MIHIYQEGNQAADWLANRGVDQLHTIHLFEEAPLDLQRIIVEDACEIALPCMIPR